jgi:hypothetical protein
LTQLFDVCVNYVMDNNFVLCLGKNVSIFAMFAKQQQITEPVSYILLELLNYVLKDLPN